MANDNTQSVWTYDPWLGLDRDEDDLAIARRGPSCVLYLQRHGYAVGEDLRRLGPGSEKLLPASARSVSSTVMRCHRLSSSLRKLPADIMVRYVLPYVIEADDEESGNGFSDFQRMRRIDFAISGELEDFRELRESEAWSLGDRHPLWKKFCFDYAYVCDYDQVVSIHAINMISYLWWKLNHDGIDPQVMLEEVKQEYALVETCLASLLLATAALSLSAALHGAPPPQADAFSRVFGRAIELKPVEAIIAQKIGWRCLYTTTDHMLSHLFSLDCTYEGLSPRTEETQQELVRRCANISRICACHELFHYSQTLITASIVFYARRSMFPSDEDPWTSDLQGLTGFSGDLVSQLVTPLQERLIPDPAHPVWPWAHVGEALGDPAV